MSTKYFQKSGRVVKTYGFTLIELLVVIAIISLLLSIMIPSLSKAKDRAREVVCKSSERQLFLTFTMYDSDHGTLPPIRYYNPSSDPPTYYRKEWWMWYLHPYVMQQTEIFACLATPKDRLWWFDRKIFKKGNSYAMSYPIRVGNGSEDTDGDGDSETIKGQPLSGPMKLAGVIGSSGRLRPEKAVLIGEMNWGNLFGNANSALQYWMPPSILPNNQWYARLNNHRDKLGQVFLYCDGHIETIVKPTPDDVTSANTKTDSEWAGILGY